MDDCNLDKLTIKPGKLAPAFKKDVLEYSVTLASDIAKITLDLLTSDSGASYTIFGGDGGKTIPLPEGTTTDIRIEVTAEDGKTIKNYIIHAKRLSAKDASLTGLAITEGKLEPEFNPSHFEYHCLVPAQMCTLKVTPTVPDNKCALTVNGASGGADLDLNVGLTRIEVAVTSVDGSNSQVYTVAVERKPFPRLVRLEPPALAAELEDPVSLAPLHAPVMIRDSTPPHAFSEPMIRHLTRTAKVDPLDGQPLATDWCLPAPELEARLAGAEASVVLTGGGVDGPVKMRELGKKLQAMNKPLPMKEFGSFSHVQVTHTQTIRPWEKQLQKVFDESDPVQLQKSADQAVQKALAALPRRPDPTRSWPDGTSPVHHLNTAAYCLATAISNKPKDANLHLQLGAVLEEKYWVQDSMAIRDKEAAAALTSNQAAVESSKEEEVQAIVKLRGFQIGCPIALQLKALDLEYHQLLEQGQSAKADHVMGLYAWKSKRASAEGATSQKAESEESPLGQAFLKYMDALSLSDAKAVHNLHVGRLLVLQGNYEEAVPRLESCLSWNAKVDAARFCLGFALAARKDGPGPRAAEAARYLQEGLELLLVEATAEATRADEFAPRTTLLTELFFRPTNTLVLRGVVLLGRLLTASPVPDCLSARDAFHAAALLAARVLPQFAKGDLYSQVEWVLLDSHAALLDLLSAEPAGKEELIQRRCERLSALITLTTIPANERLVQMQEKTCQQLVHTSPCSSVALYQLGLSQFSRAESSPPDSDEFRAGLADALASFRAAIALEGRPAAGEAPKEIAEQRWWQERKAAAEKKAAASAPPQQQPVAGKAPVARGAPAAGARAIAGRGRGAPAAAKGGAAAGRGAAAPRGGKAAPAPARGGAARGGAARGGKAPAAAAKAPAAAAPAKEETPEAAKEEKKEEAPAAPARAAPVNKPSYLPRLGLARAYRLSNEPAEASKFYDEVIKMCPDLHDAYIESAEMLAKSDPLAAVDVYCKFPVDEDNLTFDDAYIFGEIVRTLVKFDKLDDPRLVDFMIKWGKVMGLSVLDKYIEALDNKMKSKACMAVFAGVNGKAVDDPDLQPFFKMKCWI